MGRKIEFFIDNDNGNVKIKDYLKHNGVSHRMLCVLKRTENGIHHLVGQAFERIDPVVDVRDRSRRVHHHEPDEHEREHAEQKADARAVYRCRDGVAGTLSSGHAKLPRYASAERTATSSLNTSPRCS